MSIRLGSLARHLESQMTRPIHFLRPDERTVEMLPWSDQDLDEMAQITPEDVDKAKRYWRRFLPRRFRDLLDARSMANNG